MGWFLPSTLTEEVDPRWQRRRRMLLTGFGTVGLVIAAAAIWYFQSLRDPGQPAPTSAAPTAGNGAEARGSEPNDPETSPSDNSTDDPVIPGFEGNPRQDPDGHRAKTAEAARRSLERGDPWVLKWLREWDRVGAYDADLEEELLAVETFLLVGDRVRADRWHRHLLSRLADSRQDRLQVANEFPDRWQALQWLMTRRLDKVLEFVRTREAGELASDDLVLLELGALRGMTETADEPDLTREWATRLVATAAGAGHAGDLAKAVLLQLLQTGQVDEWPLEIITATGDPLPAAGPARVDRELTDWLRQEFGNRNDTGAPGQWAELTLTWALTDDESAPLAIEEMVEAAAGFKPMERVFVAEWLWRVNAFEEVSKMLGPGTDVPLTVLTLDLYASAMTQLGRQSELKEEMLAEHCRWPEALALLWQTREAASQRGPEVSGMLQGLLMRSARQAQAEGRPAWVFDVARTAYTTGFETTGRELLLISAEAKMTRERGLTKLLHQTLRSGDRSEAVYILNQLCEGTNNPGPWHGLWLWLRLMEPDIDPGMARIIMAEARRWLEGIGNPPLHRAEAGLIAVMAAVRAGEPDIARSLLPRVAPNELPTRYLPFYLKLRKDLRQDHLVTRLLEKRWGDRPVFLTPDETAWLGQPVD